MATTYKDRTLAEWEALRDKAIQLGEMASELYCNAHVRLMREGHTDEPTHPERK